jgi:BirA family biotin operon repressor/biotin-[acetyl-CoA-carboxylase] ligase
VASWPPGYGREIHDRLDSTNAEALRRAVGGERGPTWILAREQTAGRGRRGRAWASPQGAFSASLLLRPPTAPEAALRSFTAALALLDAAATFVPAARLSLKWPNDVLLDGRKLAGILLESQATPDAAVALVIGVGVNLDLPPDASALEEGALAPISLAAAAPEAPPGPEAFLDALAPAFHAWEKRLVAEGFAPVREAWLARAARLGEPVTARLPGREVTGLFETIDPTGALVLATPEGRVTLPAAEVHFPDEPRHAARD